MPDHMTLVPIYFAFFLVPGKEGGKQAAAGNRFIVPQCRCFPKAVAHRRISTASLVGGREEVSLSPGKDRHAPACRSWLHALRVSLVSVIAPPHVRSLSRGTVPVVRIFFCQGANPAYMFSSMVRFGKDSSVPGSLLFTIVMLVICKAGYEQLSPSYIGGRSVCLLPNSRINSLITIVNSIDTFPT